MKENNDESIRIMKECKTEDERINALNVLKKKNINL